MKTKLNKERVIAAVATLLLIFALIGIGLYHSSNRSLKSGLNETKLKSENLLAEKLALQKEAEKLKNDIQSWKGKSEEADRLLDEALTKITDMEKTMNRLRKDNASMNAMQKELAELKQIRKDLETQLSMLDLQNKNNLKQIEEMNAELAALRSERDNLKAEVKELLIASTDDFRIEPRKGKKDKLTIKAAKTDKLVVSFEIPQSISDDVRFRIITPQGRVIKSIEEGLSYQVIEAEGPLVASLAPNSGEFEISKRIEMTYKPKQKLSSGTYKIEIYSKEDYAGSCQVRLK